MNTSVNKKPKRNNKALKVVYATTTLIFKDQFAATKVCLHVEHTQMHPLFVHKAAIRLGITSQTGWSVYKCRICVHLSRSPTHIRPNISTLA